MSLNSLTLPVAVMDAEISRELEREFTAFTSGLSSAGSLMVNEIFVVAFPVRGREAT